MEPVAIREPESDDQVTAPPRVRGELAVLHRDVGIGGRRPAVDLERLVVPREHGRFDVLGEQDSPRVA
jgi:hypothetical protein